MKRTALITGGTRGIGLGIARSLADKGYDLALNGVRKQEDIQEVLDKLAANGAKVMYCQGDIGSDEDRKRIVDAAWQGLGRIDVLVNNAGVAPKKRVDIMELEEEGFDYVVNVNLKGTFFLSQLVAQKMINQKREDSKYSPCIITITSVSATVASTNRGEYCIAKAGLAMMTKLFAARLGEENIPVYEIRPGIIETDMTAGVKEKYDKLIDGGLTIEKRWGTPADIGAIALVLAEGGMPYSTGQVIYADGGMNVRRL
ncbi:MAG TPA: 3-ketoacyl-ACP reductase [Cyclobacteriaceae bacterium]|nr:MAG: 3-ketoacyl-ACP reductase [Bacteroidota bacterium]